VTNNDVIVFWRGTEDVRKNNTKQFIVINNSHTNIILMDVSHRHDLINWSCVNNEIKSLNRKLDKIMKGQKHVTVLRAECDRELFRNHGLHLNKLDKKTVAKQIVDTCMTVLQEKEIASIPMPWKDKQSATDDSNHIVTQTVINRRILPQIRIMNLLECPREIKSLQLTKQVIFLW
jgi:hypothetical protein